MAKDRAQARIAKDWKKSDELRDAAAGARLGCARHQGWTNGDAARRSLTRCSRPRNFSSSITPRIRSFSKPEKYVWDALKQIPSYLKFRLKPAVLGELVGKPFISGSVFIGRGTIVEQGAMLKGPAWIGENCHIRSGCYVRENVIVGQRRGDGKLLRIQELHHLR